MSSVADVTIAVATEMPRFEDVFINLQEVLRRLTEGVVKEIMSAEADQLCDATGHHSTRRRPPIQSGSISHIVLAEVIRMREGRRVHAT